MPRVWLVVSVLALGLGCAHFGPGEGGAFISGQLRSEGAPLSKCQLSVLLKDGRVAVTREIQPTFRQLVLLKPGLEAYSVEIACAGTTAWRRDGVTLGRSQEVPLGEVRLELR